jgi:hypothetical protein
MTVALLTVRVWDEAAPPRSRPQAPIYLIELEGRAGSGSSADNIRALRWLLKRLLRNFGLRCISLREEQRR